MQTDCRGDEIELSSYSQLIGACAQIRLGIQHVRDVDAAFKSHEKSILTLVMLYIWDIQFFSVQLIPKSRVDPDSRTLRAVPVFTRCLYQMALWYRVSVPGFHQIVGKDSSFYSFSAGAVPVKRVNIGSWGGGTLFEILVPKCAWYWKMFKASIPSTTIPPESIVLTQVYNLLIMIVIFHEILTLMLIRQDMSCMSYPLHNKYSSSLNG